jgi:hypothetical protein
MTPEERRAAKRARYAAHREQECKKKREWYAANVAKAREQSRRHKIKKGLQSDRRQAWSRWTPERIAQLRQMRADGITYRECAAALNSSRFACENAEPVLAKHTARRRESDAQAAMWRQLLGAAV